MIEDDQRQKISTGGLKSKCFEQIRAIMTQTYFQKEDTQICYTNISFITNICANTKIAFNMHHQPVVVYALCNEIFTQVRYEMFLEANVDELRIDRDC